MVEVNKVNTPIEKLGLDKQSKEFQEKFWNYFYNVPYIQSLVSPKRKYAKDCPRDPRYKDGRIIVDLENPHILENMDYFRKTAITFEKTGKFTELKPNPNPNSEYYKWLKREVYRCYFGMVRPSDGEYVTGDMYFYMNYMEMQLAEKSSTKSKRASRVYKMPKVWDGVYYYFHYIEQAREEGLHSGMLSSRGRSKSYIASSMLAKRFKLGESPDNDRGCTCYITASDKKFLVAGDQTLDKFQHNIDFISQNTEWPGRQMLANRLQDMLWTAGYKDLDLGNKGTGNSVVGISSNNDEEKLRGTRAVLYVLEEAGSFARLNKVWANILPSVEQGQGEDRAVYGQIIAYGTSGDKDSDFKAFANMLYHPKGFHIKPLKNVYDIEGKGGPIFSYFYPAYLNNEGCYDKDGNSDVTKALFQILKDRENVKNNSSDINAAMKRTAEYPIVPQEAILKIQGNRFPIEDINERIVELESNPHEYDDTLVGTLIQNPDGTVKFKPTEDDVITDYPLGDNKAHGALQIFKEPEKDASGKVYPERYVIGHDPINQDDAESKSLASFFVIDMWTESIAAEYTGRQDQESVFELGRLLCIYYNAQMLYESNNKMCYSYFSKMNCTYMLADTPEYLRERDIVKSTGYGNSAKGISGTTLINNHEDDLIEQWLKLPKTKYETNQEGEEVAVTIRNVKTIRNLALLKELSLYGVEGNYDRCVLKDTLITTNDGINAIQNLKVGDRVLTADGMYNKIIQLHKSKFKGNKVAIRAVGDFRVLECTDNHPILVKTNHQRGGKYWMKDRYNLTDAYYKRADQITKNDLVLVPIRKNLEFVDLPEDLLYLIGWYIADGNISSGNYVKFFLGEDQKAIGDNIVKILNKYFAKEQGTIVESCIDKNGRYIPSYITPQGSKAFIKHSKDVWNGKIKSMWVVSIASKEAQQFFKYYGGSPNAKDICDELYNKRGLLPLLKGYFEGDGHYRDEIRCDGLRRNTLEVNTIYKNLAFKIRQILLDNYLWCTIREVKPRKEMKKYQYNIALTNQNVIPIIQGSLKFKQSIPERIRSVKEVFILDEYGFWVKHKDISLSEYEGYVYNISVENNPSYVANGITTHNCRALGVTLVLRNAYVVKYGGNVQATKEEDDYDVYTDEFFKRNGFI